MLKKCSINPLSGFTLLELSIVLVIIGLVVGGVLVGRDLIKAAEMRAQVSQIEKFDTAYHTFQTKYNCLPGDCADAASFGFAARGTGPGRGDGNGVIEGTNGLAYGNVCVDQTNGCLQSVGETALFWRDLSDATLINEHFTTASATSIPPSDIKINSTPALRDFFPKAAIGNNNYLVVYSENSTHWFNLFGAVTIDGQLAYIDASLQGLAGFTGLTAMQAYAIDSKMDDGNPHNGHVLAKFIYSGNGFLWARGIDPSTGYAASGALPGNAAPKEVYTCYDNGGNASAPIQYSISTTTPNCALSLRIP